MDKGYILVVDDEPDARAALAELLCDGRCRVEAAAHASIALSKLEQGEADILLTDRKMPGMDGVELLRRLRDVNEGRVVAIVMTKPVRMAELIPVLERGLERRRHLNEAEQARRRLEAANQDLEAFARRVAHDLRTPLMPITLWAGSLKLQSGDPKVVRTADRAASGVHGGGRRRDDGPGQVRRAVTECCPPTC